MMKADALAALHARAFTRSRPWSAGEIEALLRSPLVFLCTTPQAFALGRVVDGEAELLTIATDPAHQRKGHGGACLRAFETEAEQRGAQRVFLEVDSENEAALRLYQMAGYNGISHRWDYYSLSDGRRVDAIIMAKPLLC